nr:hypothetical protein [Allomuricauda sp.]
MEIYSHLNPMGARSNSYKDKGGSSCKLCNPHKNGWEHRFGPKDRALLKAMRLELESI